MRKVAAVLFCVMLSMSMVLRVTADEAEVRLEVTVSDDGSSVTVKTIVPEAADTLYQVLIYKQGESFEGPPLMWWEILTSRSAIIPGNSEAHIFPNRREELIPAPGYPSSAYRLPSGKYYVVICKGRTYLNDPVEFEVPGTITLPTPTGAPATASPKVTPDAASPTVKPATPTPDQTATPTAASVKSDGGNDIALWICIGAAAVVTAGIVIIVLLKKKK